MNLTATTEPATLRDALYALSMAKEIPDAEALDEMVRSYPQFSEQLTEFAISIALDALRGDAAAIVAEAAIDPNVTSAAVTRAMSRFQNRLHSVGAAGPTNAAASRLSTTSDVANPFVSLKRDEFRAVAERLNVNTVFVLKLRDRQIDAKTIPTRFQAQVAGALSAPLDLVAAHFSAQRPTGVRAQHFKADAKPTDGGSQSFEEAVRSSGLTVEQQRALLSM